MKRVLIDGSLPINEVLTLPGGESITALPSKKILMACNVSTQNKRNSVLIELAFARIHITEALTEATEPTSLESKGNDLRWHTTLEVGQDQVKFVSPISYEYALTPKNFSSPTAYHFDPKTIIKRMLG